MFGKLMKKKPEHQELENRDETVETPNSSFKPKKKLTSADVVLGVGLMAILWGMFSIIGGSSSESVSVKAVETPQAAEDTTGNIKKQNISVPKASSQEEFIVNVSSAPMPSKTEEKPPFVYENRADFSTDNLIPPPEAYEQNNTQLAKKTVNTTSPRQEQGDTKTEAKPMVSTTTAAMESHKQAVTMQKEAAKQINQTIKNEPVATDKRVGGLEKKVKRESKIITEGYVCTIEEAYQDMLGKEIMYYSKDEQNHKYIPAYSQVNWDESGVLVKKRLMVTQVDMSERMAEVEPGKWIPALEFMTCIVLQEDR